MKDKPTYGGMAVIEGVMMRGPEETALAVRKPDGSIEIEKEANSGLSQRYPFLKWPFIRGTYALIDSMVVGISMLNKSANMSMAEEEEELSAGEMMATVVVAFVLAMGLFVALPTAVVHFSKQYIGGVWEQNLVEGIIRIMFFFLYIYAISKMKEIERVFMYHGAEHKSILAFEAGEELTVANARRYSTRHPRCGTSFLLIVMVVSILVFAVLGDGTLFYRVWSRIAAFPIVAGLGYEFIRCSGKYHQNKWAHLFIAPGLWLQKLTTREPDDSQLEVALAALREVVADKTQTSAGLQPA